MKEGYNNIKSNEENICNIDESIFDKNTTTTTKNTKELHLPEQEFNINYNDLHNMCEQYLRLINKNKVYMNSFYSTMTQLW